MFLKTVTNNKHIGTGRCRIRRFIKGKRGSYLVEAAIALPLFLIAVMVMSSVILMYACIENSCFIAAGEMRRSAAEAVFANTSVLLPHRIKKEITDAHSQAETLRVTDYGYRTSRWRQDELIILTLNMRLRTPNPIGLKAKADYRLSMVTRAYVGKIRSNPPMSASEMSGGASEPVYIFPKRGERYHSEGCGFLRAASTSGTLTSSVRRKYKSCPLCRSGRAASGSRIYYFPAAGEDYHLAGCPALQRNYIEIDRKDAEERGYSPCSKCGG